MTTMTVKLNKDEETLFNNYSEKSGLGVSTLLKKALMNQIEDEDDLKIFEASYKEYLQDTQTLSHTDFKKELEL